VEKRDDFYIPEEIAEWIGLKKSEFLSLLIQKQPPGDIGFEEFHLFDQFIPGTIENPDKSVEWESDDQKLMTYIRSYSEKFLFHQIVQGVLIKDKSTKAIVFVPILSFVTKSDELAREFSVGSKVIRQTLN
jgi:hypothetical protein